MSEKEIVKPGGFVEKMKQYLENKHKGEIGQNSNVINQTQTPNKVIDYVENKSPQTPIIKKKLKALNNKGKIGARILMVLGAATSILAIYCTAQMAVNKYKSEKIDKAIEFYNVVEDYIGTDALGIHYSFKTQDKKQVKIGLDRSVNENMVEQIGYCVDYLNSMFQSINPNYKFVMENMKDDAKYDIKIQVEEFANDIGENLNVIAHTDVGGKKSILDMFSYSDLTIRYNKRFEDYNPAIRFSIMHEFMHCMLFGQDLTYNNAQGYNHDNVPFSLFSYSHFRDMMETIYDKTYSLWARDCDDEFKDYIENKFVTYTPSDIAAFAARYGNLNDEKNKANCIKLIVDSYNECKKVFGEQNYFHNKLELNAEGYPVKYELYPKKTANLKSSKNITHIKNNLKQSQQNNSKEEDLLI